jgi:xanthine dehydrogenase YagR molybdenum-binding subunit
VSTTALPISIGSASPRADGIAKVTGQARYAAEFKIAGRAYGCIAQSAIARGRIVSVNADEVRSCPGVIEVLTHASAPRLHPVQDTEAWLLQDNRVHYHGQVVALVIAETLEQAQAAAEQLHVEYDIEPHDVVLRADHPGRYAPDHVNPDFPSETHAGDVDAAFGQAAFAVDQWYATPAEHCNPIEPHAATAYWDDGRLRIRVQYGSSQPWPHCSASTRPASGSSPSTSEVDSVPRPASGHPLYWQPSHRKWPGGPLPWSSPGGKCSPS